MAKNTIFDMPSGMTAQERAIWKGTLGSPYHTGGYFRTEFRWTVGSPEQIRKNGHKFLAENSELVRQELVNQGRQITKYMKMNAPWRDRTGFARRQLYSTVISTGDSRHVLNFGHGIKTWYGAYLEFKDLDDGGRPIVRPTRAIYAPIIAAAIAKRIKQRRSSG